MTICRKGRIIKNRPFLVVFFSTLFIILLFKGYSCALNFDIYPIKIFFNEKVRIEKLTIRNISDADLSLQVRVYKWSQDAKGNDTYTESPDIIVFPKILKIAKGDEKFIRVGTNLGPDASEKTYRIYIEELPLEGASQQEGASVSFTMRVGVPVFVNPQQNDPKGKIESITMSNGKAGIKINNNGNIHVVITSFVIKGGDNNGKELFSKELGGWYLLAGSSRLYEVQIQNDMCTNLAKLNIAVKTDRLPLNETLNVTKGMCGYAAK